MDIQKLLVYSNGWGHLIMSLATMAAGMYLVVSGGVNTAYGMTLIGIVTAAWFVPGAAKQVAHSVVEEQSNAVAAQVSTYDTVQLPAIQPIPRATPPQSGANSNAANSAS